MAGFLAGFFKRNSQLMLTMEDALKQSNVRFAEEEIVTGKVIEIRQKEVLVDIGYKSEGSISTNEFDEDEPPKVGDEVDVLIERLENRDGMVELSHERAEFKRNWDKLNSICQEGGRIKGKIKQAVRGHPCVDTGHWAHCYPRPLGPAGRL